MATLSSSVAFFAPSCPMRNISMWKSPKKASGRNVSRLPRLCGPWSSFHFNSLSQLEDGNFLRTDPSTDGDGDGDGVGIGVWDEAHTKEPNDFRLAPTWCFRNMCKQLPASDEREPRSSLLDLKLAPFVFLSVSPSVCIFSLIFVN